MKVTREAGKSFFLTIIQASFKFSTATCYLPPATDVSATTKVFCIFSQYVPSVTGGWIEERYTIIRFTRQDLITKTCIQVGRRKKWKSAPFLRPGKGVKKVHPGGFSQTNQFFFRLTNKWVRIWERVLGMHDPDYGNFLSELFQNVLVTRRISPDPDGTQRTHAKGLCWWSRNVFRRYISRVFHRVLYRVFHRVFNHTRILQPVL